MSLEQLLLFLVLAGLPLIERLIRTLRARTNDAPVERAPAPADATVSRPEQRRTSADASDTATEGRQVEPPVPVSQVPPPLPRPVAPSGPPAGPRPAATPRPSVASGPPAPRPVAAPRPTAVPQAALGAAPEPRRRPEHTRGRRERQHKLAPPVGAGAAR